MLYALFLGKAVNILTKKCSSLIGLSPQITSELFSAYPNLMLVLLNVIRREGKKYPKLVLHWHDLKSHISLLMNRTIFESEC